MTSTIPLGTVKLIGEIIGRALFFPIWWYSLGLVGVLRFAGRSVRNQYESLGLGVWLKNLFVPMYGSTDWAGRLISFFIRLFMIGARGLLVVVWMIIILVLVIAYLILLPISFLGFIYHLSGLVIPSLYVLF